MIKFGKNNLYCKQDTFTKEFRYFIFYFYLFLTNVQVYVLFYTDKVNWSIAHIRDYVKNLFYFVM